MIYLVTVNYYSTELIARLLASLAVQTDINYQFIIVNNSPDDRALQALATARICILEAGENLGFGAGCNLALRHIYATDPHAIVWLVNPDTIVPANMLEKAAHFCLTYPLLALIGTRVYQPDGTVWFGGGEFNPKTGRIVAETNLEKSDRPYRETEWITGCSLILNLKNFSACPLFDSAYFLYYEDFDFCRRAIQHGHAIAITDHLHLIHYPSSITQRNPALKLQHSTDSYLLALTRHTHPGIVAYRLGRILAHALRVSGAEPEQAIAIIKGVGRYAARVRNFGKSTVD